jgi:hypothetical protein
MNRRCTLKCVGTSCICAVFSRNRCKWNKCGSCYIDRAATARKSTQPIQRLQKAGSHSRSHTKNPTNSFRTPRSSCWQEWPLGSRCTSSSSACWIRQIAWRGQVGPPSLCGQLPAGAAALGSQRGHSSGAQPACCCVPCGMTVRHSTSALCRGLNNPHACLPRCHPSTHQASTGLGRQASLASSTTRNTPACSAPSSRSRASHMFHSPRLATARSGPSSPNTTGSWLL